MISEHDTTVRFTDDGFRCLKEKIKQRNRENEKEKHRKGNGKKKRKESQIDWEKEMKNKSMKGLKERQRTLIVRKM